MNIKLYAEHKYTFANLMFQGKTKAALRLLSEQSKGGVLHLDDPIETENGQRKVRDILQVNQYTMTQ